MASISTLISLASTIIAGIPHFSYISLHTLSGSLGISTAKNGDILSISEKVISICQGTIKKMKDVHVSRFTKVISRFGKKTVSGIGITEPYKLQLMVDLIFQVYQHWYHWHPLSLPVFHIFRISPDKFGTKAESKSFSWYRNITGIWNTVKWIIYEKY